MDDYEFTRDDIAIGTFLWPYIMRTVRAVAFAACALLLLSVNTYPLGGFWGLAIAVGILGGATADGVLGKFAIAVLLAMALFPYPMALALAP